MDHLSKHIWVPSMFSKYCSCTLLLLLANHIQLLADVQPHGLQHARLFCPPLSSGVCSHSRPLNGGCYLTILSSEPFSFCHKYFLALGSFPMTQLFASGGQSIGASASTSVLPLNFQGWLPLWLIGLVSLQSKGHSKVFYRTTIWKNQFFSVQSSLWFNSHLYMATGK